MYFTKDMFPSETKLETEKTHREKVVRNDKWSYLNFIAFCIAKYSPLNIYINFSELNFVQDLIFYVLVGIPLCYLQLILGQYASTGIYLIRRMLPIAQGITYTYFITIFAITVVMVNKMQTNLIYLILAVSPSDSIWSKCPPKMKNSCWNFSDVCTKEKPCMTAETFLSTYLFWNQTYMGGVYAMEEATFGIPDYRGVVTALVCWLFVYFLTIIKFKQVKQSVIILVTLSTLAKVLVFLKFGFTLGFINLFAVVLKIDQSTWLSIEVWRHSLRRVISSMMLGDFTFMMFGVYATCTTKTESLSFIGALCGYIILFLETLILKGAVMTLVVFSFVAPENKHWFFVGNAPTFLIVTPGALSVLGASKAWEILYFCEKIISYLIWCVVNITFMQGSLYQRFARMESYYKYVCPAFCMFGFSVGIFVQTKEIFEICFDVILLIDSFCQHWNLILLTVMVVYIYGFKRFGDDIQFMTGKQPADFWKVTWIVAPLILILSAPTRYFDSRHIFFTIRMMTIAIVFLPVILYCIIVAGQKIYRRDIFGLLKSDILWGPKDENLRKKRNAFKPRKHSRYKTILQDCPHQCILNNSVYKSVVNQENQYDKHVLHVIAK